jgi:hypothetical protein
VNFPGDDEHQRRMRNLRTLALVIVVLIFSVILLQSFLASPDAAEKQIQYSEFWQLVQAGQVTAVTIRLKGQGAATVAGRVRPPSALADTPQLAELDEKIQQYQQRLAKVQRWLEVEERQAAFDSSHKLIAEKRIAGWAIRASELERSWAPSPKCASRRPSNSAPWCRSPRQGRALPHRGHHHRPALPGADPKRSLPEHRGRQRFVVDLHGPALAAAVLHCLIIVVRDDAADAGEGSSALNFGAAKPN